MYVSTGCTFEPDARTMSSSNDASQRPITRHPQTNIKFRHWQTLFRLLSSLKNFCKSQTKRKKTRNFFLFFTALQQKKYGNNFIAAHRLKSGKVPSALDTALPSGKSQRATSALFPVDVKDSSRRGKNTCVILVICDRKRLCRPPEPLRASFHGGRQNLMPD